MSIRNEGASRSRRSRATRAVLAAWVTLGPLAIAPASAQQTTMADTAGSQVDAAAKAWPVAGHLGQMQFVVLPGNAGRPDEAAYRRQADLLCAEMPTCFLRFFDNPQGLALSMPLPDEILTRPTARYSRSGKRGAAVFEWSCRVAPMDGYCF